MCPHLLWRTNAQSPLSANSLYKCKCYTANSVVRSDTSAFTTKMFAQHQHYLRWICGKKEKSLNLENPSEKKAEFSLSPHHQSNKVWYCTESRSLLEFADHNYHRRASDQCKERFPVWKPATCCCGLLKWAEQLPLLGWLCFIWSHFRPLHWFMLCNPQVKGGVGVGGSLLVFSFCPHECWGWEEDLNLGLSRLRPVQV